MKIEHRPIAGIIPYEKNPRKNQKAVAATAASIQEYGWQQPIVVDAEGVVIAGHTRLQAAKKLGLATCPVVVATDLTPEQVRAYRIMDNRSGELAEWDDALLKEELIALDEIDFNLELTGFSTQDLENFGLLSTAGNTDPDDVPAAPADPVTRPGDIWELGRHRLMCGDATVRADVAGLLHGAAPHLMVTDPPYGVEYDADWRNNADRANGEKIGSRAIGRVHNDDNADWRQAWALFPGDVAYIWHASNYVTTVAESLQSCGFEMRTMIIWAKNQLVISRGHYHHQHEPCWYAVRKGKTAHWNGSRKKSTLWRYIDDILRPGEQVYACRQDAETIHAISGDESTVWEINKPMKSETGHSTQKPVESACAGPYKTTASRVKRFTTHFPDPEPPSLPPSRPAAFVMPWSCRLPMWTWP